MIFGVPVLMLTECQNISKVEKLRRKKISKSTSKYWKNKAHRRKRLASIRKANKKKSRRDKISKSNARYWLGTKGARFGKSHKAITKRKIACGLRRWRTQLKRSPHLYKQWCHRQSVAHTGHTLTLASRRKESRSHRIRYKTFGIKRGRRECVECQIWREKVLNRDGYICIMCSSKKNLEVDHIKPWCKFPKLRFIISNGRTLCKKCHLEHGWRGNLGK